LEVEISLYGANRFTHEAVTAVEGSYAKTLLAIKLLKEREVRVHVKTSILKENTDEIEALRRMVEDMGASFFYDALLAPRDDGDKSPLACRASSSDLLRIFKEMSPQRGDATFQPKEIAIDSPMCNAGINSVCISPYGDVYPCVQIRKPLGNLREKSFREIWEDSEVLAQLRAIKLSSLPVCSSCALLPFCARCPGVALMEEGDILAPSKEACRIASIRKAIFESTKDKHG
jgi:radical SAM protein with 4Fe4S-binding SPASM domain